MFMQPCCRTVSASIRMGSASMSRHMSLLMMEPLANSVSHMMASTPVSHSAPT